jgi:peptidoglycan hydrolase-like amidase
VNGTAGENRTVNEAPIEQYLRSVVASEMSASWAPRPCDGSGASGL